MRSVDAGRALRGGTPRAPEGAGRAAEEGPKRLVEAADAAEAGREGDLGEGHRGLVDELLGEQHPPRLRDRHRRGAGYLLERAAGSTRDAEPRTKGLDARLAVEPALDNRGQGPTTPVFEVPRQKARSGAVSGPGVQAGRNPASCAAAAEGKKRQFSNFGVRAGQIGRQSIPVEVTPVKRRPSKRGSRV